MAAPVLQALLVADQIYQDQGTGKFVICGIFGTIFFLPPDTKSPAEKSPDQSGVPAGGGAGAGSGAGPGSGAGGGGGGADGATAKAPDGKQQMPLNRLIRAGSPSAYVSLTELHGHRSFELRYVDLKDNTVIFTVEFKVESRSPLETVQLSVPLPPLPVPHEGLFALELLCEGELLGSHRILTKRHPKP
jgi:hypothetical protein